MAQKKAITNNLDIPLMLAVWLVHDEYDYISSPNYISATGLMKPLRHILLPKRIPIEEQGAEDVESFVSRGLGHSIHDSIEKAWMKGGATNLRKLGYPEDVISRVVLNPSDADLDRMAEKGVEPIPVYLEQRMFREHNGLIIGGKYDGVTEGIVNDTKSTSAYSWVFGGHDSQYQLQGSIYRWIDQNSCEDVSMDPDTKTRPRITEDYIRINFVFTDWQKMQAKTNKGYPPRRVMEREIQLLSLEETEKYIDDKLALIERYKDVPEDQIPECTPEELWQSDPVYKFYNDPEKAKKKGARSTKNFDDLMDARKFQAEKGGIGVIKTIPGEPKRCAYCPAFDVCTQKDAYFP